MKLKLIVNGAAGRMGKRILAIAIDSGNFDIFAAADAQNHSDLGKDAGLLAGIYELGVKLTDTFPVGADVMIDFTLPIAADATIEYCVKNKVALVMGTTGLSAEQIKKVDAAAKTIPVIQTTNFSVGMNLLFKIVGQVAAALGPDYDIEITEAHHRFKKDSPSGSALSLAESIAKSADMDYPACLVHGREGRDCLREKGTIGMHAIRAGDIVGQHSVIYGTLGETITISHNAHSRDTFALGAVRAAKWLADKKPGKYSMADVLGL